MRGRRLSRRSTSCISGSLQRSPGFRPSPISRALRGPALSRNNFLFAGADSSGERAAAMYSLQETAKLERLEPRGPTCATSLSVLQNIPSIESKICRPGGSLPPTKHASHGLHLDVVRVLAELCSAPLKPFVVALPDVADAGASVW